MVTSFLAAICGLTLSTQVRMCTVTAQQLAAPYTVRIEEQLQPIVEHLGNNYIANGVIGLCRKRVGGVY
ncbi:hypothetical protein EB118_04210 [bacterium]|nr:hypothetical protein [bacterium]